MAEILAGWYWLVIAVSIIFGITDSIIFMISLGSMAESRGIKKGLFFFFLCSIITIIYTTFAGIFGVIGYSITKPLWMIIPIGFFIVALFFIISVRTIMKSLKEIEKKT